MIVNKMRSDADLILEISSILMSSGANTNRILLIMSSFSKLLGYEIDVLITHRAFILTLENKDKEQFTTVKRLPHHGVNFRAISALSRASFFATRDSWTTEKIREELNRIEKFTHYPRLTVLTGVSAAGAGFCNLFGGDYINMLVAFVATFIGLFIRQEHMKRHFNPFVCVFIGAFVSTLIAAIGIKYSWGELPHLALATSVLYLIPGVPLINAFTDILDGHFLNGMVRFLNGFTIIFSIASAIFITMLLLDIHRI